MSAVAARLGADPFTDEASEAVSVRVSRTGGSLSALVLRSGPEGERGRRELTSPTLACTELYRALELAVAIAIDPRWLARPIAPPLPLASHHPGSGRAPQPPEAVRPCADTTHVHALAPAAPWEADRQRPWVWSSPPAFSTEIELGLEGGGAAPNWSSRRQHPHSGAHGESQRMPCRLGTRACALGEVGAPGDERGHRGPGERCWPTWAPRRRPLPGLGLPGGAAIRVTASLARTSVRADRVGGRPTCHGHPGRGVVAHEWTHERKRQRQSQ